MKTIFENATFVILTLLSSITLSAQTTSSKNENVIPLKASHWEFKPNTVLFTEYKSVSTMKIIVSGAPVVLKNIDFTDGTVEYDMEPVDPQFTSFYFRRASSDENECFYFRTARAGDKTAEDAIQYAPFISGVNLWDMLFHYQSPADFKKQTWNHVKLVISGKQMKAYVNNKTTPALIISRLEGNVTHGSIAFEGQVNISNLVIRPNVVEGLSAKAGPDPTANDPRYLRKWNVTKPVTTGLVDFKEDFLPKPSALWEPIAAERRGLINLTRKFGKNNERKIVWLKTKINSTGSQERTLDFGFSDEVWVYMNGKQVYVDKNIYLGATRKSPDGRCTIQNASIRLPFVKGENELLIGVANDFYGWGIVARLDSRAGLSLE